MDTSSEKTYRGHLWDIKRTPLGPETCYGLDMFAGKAQRLYFREGHLWDMKRTPLGPDSFLGVDTFWDSIQGTPLGPRPFFSQEDGRMAREFHEEAAQTWTSVRHAARTLVSPPGQYKLRKPFTVLGVPLRPSAFLAGCIQAKLVDCFQGLTLMTQGSLVLRLIAAAAMAPRGKNSSPVPF